MRCKKVKFDELGAKMALAKAIHRGGKREECRYYYCELCRAYHLTSRKIV